MTREVIDNFEDQLNSIRTEWHALKEKWFHGEMIDPVFEGVVRDFCTFDETMQSVYQKVGVFMKGVEQLAHGMTVLSEGVAAGLSHTNDHQIASDSCKLKEATNQIARADAPHSAIAKLRRDMQFNILNPVQSHLTNNRNLKASLETRRTRLFQLNAAKKQYEDCVKRSLPPGDKRLLLAQSNLESAKMAFNDVDRHVFEWLYILEEYRGDILDSTLQTLKYLEYEFFATSAHAISSSLPTRMEFRPMVEMTPEHLEAQVEMELQESEEVTADAGSPVADFAVRLIEKKAKEEPGDKDQPALPVDPLSLSSLLSQGFEEGPARRALRLHQNNTQLALDWLINGGEETEKKTQVADGVRMPTTVKRVQRLKAMRKAQQEKLREKRAGGSSAPAPSTSESSDGGNAATAASSTGSTAVAAPPPAPAPPAAAPPDLLEDLLDLGRDSAPAPAQSQAPRVVVADLLSFGGEEETQPTDFSKPVEMTELPAQISFDMTRWQPG